MLENSFGIGFYVVEHGAAIDPTFVTAEPSAELAILNQRVPLYMKWLFSVNFACTVGF